MRRSKALSVITSMAMAGSLIMSAIPFTASADATNPLGYKLTCDTTTFTTADGGKAVTVYVDPVGTVAESDNLGSIEFKIKSDSWGKLDPTNLILSDNNAIGTGYGNNVKKDKPYNQTGSMVVSAWDGAEKPSKPGYSLLDYKTVDAFTTYSDDYCPAVIVMSDSSCGFMRTDASYGKHIAEFQVKIPSEAGKYTLSLVDAQSMICTDGRFGSDASVIVKAPSAEGITFTVAGDSVTTTTTTTAGGTTTTTTTTIATSTSGDPLAAQRIYDGDAYLTVGEAQGNAGDTIEVPVYFKFDDKVTRKDIAGVAFKVVYDETVLELVRIEEPDEAGFSEGGFNQNPKTGIFLYNFTTADITVNPELPICNLKFKVKDGAADGSYKIDLINHLFGADVPLQIVHVQEYQKDTTYLTPHVTQGTVTVGAGEEHLIGDANQDGKVNVRDAATIASALAKGTVDQLKCQICADYNQDGKVNVRDAAAIAKDLATGKIKK